MFTNHDMAAAQEASVASSSQTAEPAGVFSMPQGDFASEAVTEKPVVIPFRSPTPKTELERLKRQGAESAAPSGVIVDSGIEPEALFRECITNAANGFAPSDSHGAASPTNLVVVTNVTVGVYRKSTCGMVSRVTLKTFFSQNGGFSIPATQTLFDPRVLYDRAGGRCLITTESSDSGNADQFLYIAASTSSSCTSWRRIRFVLSRVSPFTLFCKATASHFYDFPNAGYNLRRLVVTSNNFTSATGSFANGTVLSINKLALYGTGTVTARCFNTRAISNLAPAVVGDLNASMFILSPGSGSGNSLRRLRLDTSPAGVGSDALVSTANISIPAWTAPPNAAQPNGELLDALDGRFQSASKQIGGRLWNVHAVNSSGFARWRLYKLSTTGTSPLFTFTPTTSTCANADHLFNPSVDTNSASTSALAFVTASRTCPSQATSGRAAHLIFRGPNSSPTGWVFNTVQTSATQFVGCGSGCRWGDYSATQIDPSNTGRAWGFNQLVTGSSQFSWNTRAAQAGP
jgi:hypothetical protein